MAAIVFLGAGVGPITTTLSQTNVEELCDESYRLFVKLPREGGGYTLVNPAAIRAINDYPYDLEEKV